MKKGLLYLVAALLIVGLPLSALAGTQVFHVKEVQYPPFVPFNQYIPDCDANDVCTYMTCFSYNPDVRNPAYKYGKDICVSFDATFHEDVRVKSNKSALPDVDWNLVAHGTGFVHPGPGGGIFSRCGSTCSHQSRWNVHGLQADEHRGPGLGSPAGRGSRPR